MEVAMSAPEATAPGKGRRQLLLIIALFLLPPIGAWLAWTYLGEQGVAATTNAGDLISPARPLEVVGLRAADGAGVGDDLLRGRWSYVLFDDGACGSDSCEALLYLTRQTRLAMNKDIRRIQRVLILSDAPDAALLQKLRSEHEDLTWVVRGDGSDALLQAFTGVGFGTAGEHLFLVDPLGNLMMVYGAEVPPQGLMKDLKKLLKVSQIG
jgi:cytochrome oxidase Cu insertion factor (SCO1/SenC/PrrC family)